MIQKSLQGYTGKYVTMNKTQAERQSTCQENKEKSAGKSTQRGQILTSLTKYSES